MTAGLILAAVPALACEGPHVKFQDDFRQIDDSWNVGPHADTVTVEDGKVKVKADPSAGYTVLYGGLIFDDADLCVTVQVAQADAKWRSGCRWTRLLGAGLRQLLYFHDHAGRSCRDRAAYPGKVALCAHSGGTRYQNTPRRQECLARHHQV